MSNKQQFPSEAHLLDLIKNRKYKQYKAYVQEIQNQLPEAEQAVCNNLLHILVQKKYKDPMTMFNALVLYKHLLVGAMMDFICNDDLFPVSIHREIAKVCEYKGTEKDLKVRGSQYFVDLFKMEVNEQISSYGYNYIMLALEILKSMAVWYSCDYEDKKLKSAFKVLYDKLLQKNVYFPDNKDFLLIKPADQELFKKNYQRFLSNLDAPEQQPLPSIAAKAQKKPPVASSPPVKPSSSIEKKPSNIMEKKSSNTIEQASQQNKSANSSLIKKEIVQTKPSAKPETSVPAKKEQINTNKIQSAQQKNQAPAKPAKTDNTGNSKIQDSTGLIVIKQSLIESKFKSSISSKPQQKQENQNTSKISQKPKISSKNSQKPKISSIIASSINYSGNTLNIYPQGSLNSNTKFNFVSQFQNNVEAKPIIVSEIKRPEISKLPEPQPWPSQKPIISSIFNPVVIPKEETPAIPKKFSQQKQIDLAPKNPTSYFLVAAQEKQVLPKNRQSQLQSRFQSRKIDTINQAAFSFNKKNAVPMRHQTPKKIPKTEKPKSYQSIQKLGQHIVHPSQAFESPPKPVLTSRPRSLPKTQKKMSTTFHANFDFGDYKAKIGMVSPANVKQKQVFNKTLSYITTSRKKVGYNIQLKKFNSLLQVVDKMKLDKATIRFMSKYYQPVTTAMTMLREQALNLYGSGASYSPFYSGRGIEARAIKQINNQFVLTLHNLTTSTLLIEYFNMRQIIHSKRIKILTWGNKKQPSAFRLQPNKYFDIKFHVQIYDLNFKFLNFGLKIDGVTQQLVLPITLLDMCKIQDIVTASHLQKYSLRGSIITSQPFQLNLGGLPSFLGCFKFGPSDSARLRTENSILIGQCGLKFEKSSLYQSSQSDLHVFIKLLSNETRKIQIEILYITKDTQSEDLAKVILYLLTFLLQSA